MSSLRRASLSKGASYVLVLKKSTCILTGVQFKPTSIVLNKYSLIRLEESTRGNGHQVRFFLDLKGLIINNVGRVRDVLSQHRREKCFALPRVWVVMLPYKPLVQPD